jgi:energy-coupling factor transporter ATP-binding protein EcfA2
MLDSLTRFELQQVLLDLWQKNNITALMVTHDVDEAVFLSDRVVMMTNGPEADVGDVLEIDYPRPRDRKSFMGTPKYYEYREHLISFLNDKSHLRGDERPLITRGICPGSNDVVPEPDEFPKRNGMSPITPSLNGHNGRRVKREEVGTNTK